MPDNAKNTQLINYAIQANIVAEPAGTTGDFLYTPISSWTKKVILSLAPTCQGQIVYTVDGTDPTTTSDIYTTPITIGGKAITSEANLVVIKAARLHARSIWDRQEFVYMFDRPEVVRVSPIPGDYSEEALIVLTTKNDCHIYYTINGDDVLDVDGNPTMSAIMYTGPIDLDNFLLRAVAINKKTGKFSRELTGAYSIAKEKLEIATSHKEGRYTEPIALRLTCNDSEAMIRYTMVGDYSDGQPMSYVSSIYDDAIILGNYPGTYIIKAMAETTDNHSDALILKFTFE